MTNPQPSVKNLSFLLDNCNSNVFMTSISTTFGQTLGKKFARFYFYLYIYVKAPEDDDLISCQLSAYII